MLELPPINLPLKRPRRNRQSATIREMVRETEISVKDFIAPLFVVEGKSQKIPINSMPGQFRFSLDILMDEVKNLQDLGVPCISLFPCLPAHQKNAAATLSYQRQHFYQESIQRIKKECPELLVMSDVAMDPYSSDGHDGVVDPATGAILNDPTLEVLAKMAIAQADSGCDIIGPSDMMDGRVGYLRKCLDMAGHQDVIIMSYTAKYSSNFYGPFRDALDSAPKRGDKKSYQMDYANVREALREAQLDEEEGADILMVKPGICYLDVLKTLSSSVHLPLAVYNVSGEYSMLKAAAEKGWIDGPSAMMEMLYAFKRAGAKMILTYFAKEAAEYLRRY